MLPCTKIQSKSNIIKISNYKIRDIFSIIGKANNPDYSYNVLLSDENSKVSLTNVSVTKSNLLLN